MTRNGGKQLLSWHAIGRMVAVLVVCSMVGPPCDAADEPAADVDEWQARWGYFAPIELPAGSPAALADVLLAPQVFTYAQSDLGDLRLYDGAGRTVPYAMRVREETRRRDAYPAVEFNRAAGPDGSSELTLDLRPDGAPDQEPVEHNGVEVVTQGTEFRRHIVVEGSDDGTNWSKLAESDLVRFQRREQGIEGDSVAYPASRYRQLRVHVFPDQLVDQQPVTIERVLVVRRVDVPGELVTRQAVLGPREPTRDNGRPGSSWIIDLGGRNVPCDRIEVDVDDSEFVRNYRLEFGGPAEGGVPFQVVPSGNGVWQRRAGYAKQPLTARFGEVRASRFRLIVNDDRNPPLRIQAVRFSAPARQIIFTPPADSSAGLRLYFGNPEAIDPNYDFARNLPPELPAPPRRAALGAVTPNPDFTPPPKPWSERWPWLIYVVLGAASAVLALVIVSVARRAIQLHDQARPQATTDGR